MSFEVQSERIAAVPGGAELLVQLINLSLDAPNESDFLATALDLFRKTVNSKGVVLVRGVKGQWRIIANSGSDDSLPVELLSETLDSEKCQQSEGWTAAPLFRPNSSGKLIACNASVDPDIFDALTAAVGLALIALERRFQQQRRVD